MPADGPDDETRVHRIPRSAAERRLPPPEPPTRSWTVDAQPTQRLSIDAPEVARGAPRARRSRRRGRRVLEIGGIVLVVLAVIGVAIVVGVRSYDPPPPDDDGGVATDTPHAKHPPPRDVTLETCKITTAGAEVTGTVRNPTDDPADYVISVDLVDPDGIRITGAQIAADAVPAKSRTEWSGLLPAIASTAQRATCTVVQVDRYRAS